MDKYPYIHTVLLVHVRDVQYVHCTVQEYITRNIRLYLCTSIFSHAGQLCLGNTHACPCFYYRMTMGFKSIYTVCKFMKYEKTYYEYCALGMLLQQNKIYQKIQN